MGTGVKAISELLERSRAVRKAIHDSAFLPERKKTDTRRWSITEAAALIGRSQQAIREAEASGRLSAPEVGENNRRIGYTLADLNRMREVFGTRPWRAEEEEAVILAVSNFKGGVAKSTIACHYSQYLALHGYRVLLVDTDPQASATQTFGYIPGVDVRGEDSILPFLRGDRRHLSYAVRKTYWDGLDIIPATLDLFNAEYEIASHFSAGDLDLLRTGLNEVATNYDVVVLDAPPALGMLPLNVLRAANALAIPVPPGMYDFESTVSYLDMLLQVLVSMEKAGIPAEFKFVKVLASRVDDRRKAHTEMMTILESAYGYWMLKAKFKESAEINNAAVRLYTVYELDKAERSKESRERALTFLDSVFGELTQEVIRCWPSRAQELVDRGYLA